MHLRRGAQNRIDQHQSDSRQSLEAALELVADQKPDGDIVDQLRRKKEPDHGGAVFVGARRAPEKNREQAIRDLLQVRLCS